MKLVLAEKPSVAQSIAKVLGATKREDGYLEGNGYVVSWCVGHLVELSQPEAYDEKYNKWAYADLPIFPDQWKYQVSASTKKQFGILKKLMARKDVESLVCATDAGREGELIFRLVYQQAGCRKPFERLWIPDGGTIQVHYSDDSVVIKPCKFIDEYHTQIGNNVFHICQFAELLERNGSYCQAEPEIMGDEAAWQVGRDQYLAIQTCEDGYDYTLFDKEFHEIDGGQLDNPELSMLEARAEILAGFGLQMRELRVQVYEEVMEKAEAVEAVNASLLDLAKQIDQFSDEYDHYEYADRVDDKKSNIVEIYHDLTNGNAAPYRDFLEQVIEDSDEISVVQAATQLKNELDKAVSRPKESVIDQLKQISGQTVPSKMSHSFKEPER